GVGEMLHRAVGAHDLAARISALDQQEKLVAETRRILRTRRGGEAAQARAQLALVLGRDLAAGVPGIGKFRRGIGERTAAIVAMRGLLRDGLEQRADLRARV